MRYLIGSKIILGLSKVNDLIYDKDSIEVTVLDEGTFFDLPEDRGEVEIDAIANFTITVYNEREIVTIVEELGKKILSAYNIEILDFNSKEKRKKQNSNYDRRRSI